MAGIWPYWWPHKSQDTKGRGLTIAEAKAGLSLTFGVDPSAIEITIRA